MKVYVDDGSTGTKLAFFTDNTNDIKVETFSNRAEYGRGIADDDSCTYSINDQYLTFYPSCDSNRTSNIQYQYSDHCVAAVHHALHLAGLSGQEVDLCVTLPISEFYSDGRVNHQNIEKKKSNLLKVVLPEHGDSITIKNVSVYPEGIPAVQPRLIKNGKSIVDEDELTFLADLGGTTLDLALFSGAAKKIIRAQSFNIGMFDNFSAIKVAINLPNVRDMQISKLLETGKAAGGKFKIDRVKVTKPVMTKASNAVIDFLGNDIHALSYSFLIGGGAELLKLSLDDFNFNCVIVDDPTTALVKSIANIEKAKGE
jgi:hypothetical protein